VISIRHFLQIIDKKSGKKEEILFYFKEHQVIIVDENFVEFYNSDKHIKPKEVDNDRKETEGQETEDSRSEQNN